MFSTDKEFEDEVRRIARLLWPTAEFGGSLIIDARERDGVFEGDDFVHCIECTTSRTEVKARYDAAKLDKLLRKIAAKHPSKFLKGWFITLEEPTADQRTVLRTYQNRIVACSYEQFRAKLVDARSYISAREKYPFGSVRNPATGSSDYTFDYVPLDIVDAAGALFSVEDLSAQLVAGSRYVLTGDYGAGKSATARETFFHLARAFWSGKTTFFPVLLNLRDHHGQTRSGRGHRAARTEGWFEGREQPCEGMAGRVLCAYP